MNKIAFQKLILSILLLKNYKNDENFEDNITYLISQAHHFAKYSEYRIALEILLENLMEFGIALSDEQIALANQAFGENMSAYDSKLIELLKS